MPENAKISRAAARALQCLRAEPYPPLANIQKEIDRRAAMRDALLTAVQTAKSIKDLPAWAQAYLSSPPSKS